MLRLQDIALAAEWSRIDRRVSRLLADKRTAEATTTLLACVENDVEAAVAAVRQVPIFGE